MLKRFSCLLLIFLICVFPIKAAADDNVGSEPLSLSAKSAILICADTGKSLYSKNENQRLPMASTTKIMTALLTFEMTQSSDREVEITDQMVRVEGSSMGLLPGNVITLKNLAKGMMMCSGNDAANSIAIAIAGSNDKFCELMNEKAKLIGMNDTNFATASGLNRDDHYSTARDMAILGAYAMENKEFYDTVKCKTIKVPFIKPNESRTYRNHNKLLWQYKDCVGIKTGFTEKAGRCLVSCVEKDGLRLVAVTLNAHSDWDDHKKLYDYGFSKVSLVRLEPLSEDISINVVGSDKNSISANVKMEKTVTVNNEDANRITSTIEVPQFLNAPIEKGQVVGKVIYYLDDNIIATNELISNDLAEYKYEQKGFFDKIADFFVHMFS